MKNYLLILGISLLANTAVSAQTTEIIKVAAGNDIATAVSVYGIYRLPAFANGTVYFKDGKLGKELLNYNILNGQVMYVTKQGDTLAIASPAEIKKVAINNIIFYYAKDSWLEDIGDATAATLVVKRKVNIRYEKKGAFGLSDNTNDVDSYTSYTSDHASYQLFINDDASVTRITSYFLLTANGQLLPANKGNFYNQFASNKKDIENYLSSNKVNFNKEQDLVHLLAVTDSIKQ